MTTIEACRTKQIPAINLLDAVEAMGESERASLFIDVVHRSVKGNQVVANLLAGAFSLPE